MNFESNARPTSVDMIGCSPKEMPSPGAQARVSGVSAASVFASSARTPPQSAAAQANIFMCFEFIFFFSFFSFICRSGKILCIPRIRTHSRPSA